MNTAILQIDTIFGVGWKFSAVRHFVLSEAFRPWALALLPQFYSSECAEE
jgi:hypothetical protein